MPRESARAAGRPAADFSRSLGPRLLQLPAHAPQARLHRVARAPAAPRQLAHRDVLHEVLREQLRLYRSGPLQLPDQRLEAAARAGLPVDEEKQAMAKKLLEEQIERESDVYFATARLWDDGIIDPRETRTVLAIALMAAHQRPFAGTMKWGVFRH